MTADPLAFLHATLDAAEDEAEAAKRGGDGHWVQIDPERQPGRIETTGQPWGDVVVYDEGSPTEEQAAHIARHDPAAVLRRIAADRKQMEFHAAVPDHGRFSERDCSQAGCDGDHWQPPVCRSCRNYAGDPLEAPCATVEILAEGWGWTEETT